MSKKKSKKGTNGHSQDKKFKKLRRILGMSQTIETEHMIALRAGEGQLPPIAYCTCNWTYGPSTNLIDLGLAAKRHENETGHMRRGRG